MPLAQSASSAPDNSDSSISERLARFGVTHEEGPGGRRYLWFRGRCIGLADSSEAVALLEALASASQLSA